MKLDPTVLKTLGLNLTEEQYQSLNDHFIETLNERVGLAITDLLSDEEAGAYIKLCDSAAPAELNQWLEQHLPEYREVIEIEFDILLGELAKSPAVS